MSTSSSSEIVPRASRWKNALKNLALFATVFLVCVALAEGVLRLMGYGNVEIYQPDPLVIWRLKPNQNCYTKIDHKPVRINAHGTRGAEFTDAKPSGTIRIISLGDSRTFGWGLSNEETYSALLQKQLQEKLGPGKKVEVINAGVNAWSFPQMSVFFREFALPWQPDMVILGEANLWTQFSEKSDPAFVRKMMSRVRLKNLLRRFALYHYVVEVQLKEVYERQRSKFIPVDPKQDTLFKEQQQKDPDAFFRAAIEDLCSIALSNRVQPVLVFIPSQNTLLAPGTNAFTEVRRAKTSVSQKFNVPLLDLTPDLQPRAKDLYLDADPVHLNAAGNEIIGRRLFEVVSPFLKP
jgi:lysophospholipase L1-like esterase